MTDGELLALELSCQRAYDEARRARNNQRRMAAGDDPLAAAIALLTSIHEDGD